MRGGRGGGIDAEVMGRSEGVRVLGQRRLELIAAGNQWDAQGSN